MSGGSFAELSDRGSGLLESGDPLGALESFQEAEQAALAAGDEAGLCGMLGDMAVAYRRIGNDRAAIATYRRAIELSQRYDDALNLSRWATNLVALHTQRGEADEAEPLLDVMLDAAARTRRPDQLAASASTLATYQLQTGRYDEAVRSLDRASAEVGGEPVLEKIIRENLSAARFASGEALWRENRMDDAAARFELALELIDTSDPDGLALAVRAQLLIAEIHERSGDTKRRNQALEAARAMTEQANDSDTLALIDRALTQEAGDHLAPAGEVGAGQDYADRIAAAVAADDLEAELTARVNHASALLGADPQGAIAAFDDVWPRLRARGDRRRQLVIGINFVPALLDLGERGRALELADRCLDISSGAPPERRALALLCHAAAVWEAQHDSARSVDSLRLALDLTADLGGERDQVIDAAGPLLARAASAALDLHHLDLAAEIARLLDLDMPDLSALAPASEEVDLSTLRELTHPRLDVGLAIWRSGTAAETQNPDAPPRVAWFSYAADRMDSGSPEDADGASRGGAAGLLQLGELVAAGRLSMQDGEAALRALPLDPETAAGVCVALLRDPELAERPSKGPVLRLVAATTPDDGLAANMYCILALGPAGRGDHVEALGLYRAAAERLAGGASEPLLADVLNETSVHLHGLGRDPEAADHAERALALASRLGLDQIAAAARGNKALALMQAGQLEKALAEFQELEQEQLRRGDEQQLEITRFNILAVRQAMGQEDVDFDPSSEDPDQVFGAAQRAAAAGDSFAAIKLFERGFAKVEEGAPSHTQWASRQNYAEALRAAGRIDAAVDELHRVFSYFERANPERAAEVLLRMAELTLDQPARAAGYADRALRMLEGTDTHALRARAAELAGAARAGTAGHGAAISSLEQAWELTGDPETGLSLARHYVAAGRPSAALTLLEELEPSVAADGSPRLKIRLLSALASAHARLGQFDRAISLGEEASRLGMTDDDLAAGAEASKELGWTLLQAGRAREALQVLEQTLDPSPDDVHSEPGAPPGSRAWPGAEPHRRRLRRQAHAPRRLHRRAGRRRSGFARPRARSARRRRNGA